MTYPYCTCEHCRLKHAAPEMREILKAVDYTLTVHGHIDRETPLHDRITAVIETLAKIDAAVPQGLEPASGETQEQYEICQLRIANARLRDEAFLRSADAPAGALRKALQHARDFIAYELPLTGLTILPEIDAALAAVPQGQEPLPEANYVKDICKRLRAGHQYSGITDPLDVAAANLIETLYLASLGSAPRTHATHNSGESDPVVTPDCRGAETVLADAPAGALREKFDDLISHLLDASNDYEHATGPQTEKARREYHAARERLLAEILAATTWAREG